MEIILIILGVFILLVGTFLIVEYPYHFIGVYIFIIFYRFNIELPGPLDFRGLLSLILLFRLILFDKENLQIIFNLLIRNYVFLLILLFELIFLSISFFSSNTYKNPIKLLVFQNISLVIGFLAVYRGYGKSVFYSAIVVAGILACADLVYSFGITSQLFVRRILDVLIKTEFSTDMNHNFFGMVNGIAFAVTYVLLVSKNMNTKVSVVLLLLFGTGIFLSTSRSTMVTTFISIFIATLLFPRDQIDVKKILSLGFKGLVFLLILVSSYILILKTLNVQSDFSDKVYYRLVEEPLELFEGKTSTFRSGGSQYMTEGSASWRINKALRDFNEYLKLSVVPQLFGYGYNGYYRVGEKEFDNYDMRIQNASHNGLVTILIERGVIGIIMFFIINIILIKKSTQVFQFNIYNFPYFVIIIFMLLYTFGAAPLLLDRFGYIIIGGVLGQSLYFESLAENETAYA